MLELCRCPNIYGPDCICPYLYICNSCILCTYIYIYIYIFDLYLSVFLRSTVSV